MRNVFTNKTNNHMSRKKTSKTQKRQYKRHSRHTRRHRRGGQIGVGMMSHEWVTLKDGSRAEI